MDLHATHLPSPRGDTRTGSRSRLSEPEMLVGFAAILISVCAVAVGAYEAYLQRKHDRAQVWPHLELTLTSAPTGAALQVINAGIGPAVVRSVNLLVDGRPTSGWPEVFTGLLNHHPARYSTSTIPQRVLPAREPVTPVPPPTTAFPPNLSFGSAALRPWALRPQLKRDPLGGNHDTSERTSLLCGDPERPAHPGRGVWRDHSKVNFR